MLVKEKIKQALSITIGLIIIALIIYAGIRVLTGGWHAYKSLSDNTQIAIAVALLSLLGTLGSLYYTKIKDRQLQIEASHTAKKQKLYNAYSKDIINLIADPEKGNDETFSQRMRIRFMSDSLLWSNPKVLQTYHKFRLDAQQPDSESQIIYDIASLFLAFREDLGLSNKDINEQTILEILYDQSILADSGLNFMQDSKKSRNSALRVF